MLSFFHALYPGLMNITVGRLVLYLVLIFFLSYARVLVNHVAFQILTIKMEKPDLSLDGEDKEHNVNH